MKLVLALILATLQALVPALHAHVGGNHESAGLHIHTDLVGPVAASDEASYQADHSTGLKVAVAMTLQPRDSEITPQAVYASADEPTLPNEFTVFADHRLRAPPASLNAPTLHPFFGAARPPSRAPPRQV